MCMENWFLRESFNNEQYLLRDGNCDYAFKAYTAPGVWPPCRHLTLTTPWGGRDVSFLQMRNLRLRGLR